MNLKKTFQRIMVLFLSIVISVKFVNYLMYKSSILLNDSEAGGNCTNLNMVNLATFGEKNQFSNGIPKIIHYNYKNKMLPLQYMDLVKKCIEFNPEVKFVFWSDESSLEFIKINFPLNLGIYKSYLQINSDPLKKSDLIRYFILLHFGGIYMDLDTRCQKPLKIAMERDSCILSREAEVQTRIKWNYDFYVMNSFMACVPQHRFFKYIISKIQKESNAQIIEQTGPLFLTNNFLKYNSTLNLTDYKDNKTGISIPSSDEFSPHIEPYLENLCKQPKGQWNIKGCKDLPNYRKVEKEKVAAAVVVHLFYHLGYGFAKHLIRSLCDICTINYMNIII